MGNKTRNLLKMAALTCCLLLLFREMHVFSPSRKDAFSKDTYSVHTFAMGTAIEVTLYADKTAEAASEACIAKITELDKTLLSRRADTSELYRVNEALEQGLFVPISGELYAVLSHAAAICEATDGALDITIRPVSALWNIEEADVDTFSVPADTDIAERMCLVGFRYVSVSADNGAFGLTVRKQGMELELGAVGKGYALDVIKEVLAEYPGVTGAVIHVGGSVLVTGAKKDKSTWRIGIRNPKGAVDDMIGYLEYPAGTTVCVSTSGDYEKYIEKNGVRYHHILDAATGYPAESGLSSVTVVCENGLDSDALSTACFVLGYEKSLPVLEKYGAEAVFIYPDNRVAVTKGLRDIFHAGEGVVYGADE